MQKSYVKRLISLILVLLSITSVFILPLSVSAVTYYQTNKIRCYDSDGNQIIATSQVGNLHKGNKKGYYTVNPVGSSDSTRAYCIEISSPFPISSSYIQNTNNANSIWQDDLNSKQRNLITFILARGLEGQYKYVGSKTLKGHNIRFVEMYGHTVTVYEAYLATQLLIWEVTEELRSTNSPFTAVKGNQNLYKAYSGTARRNIETIYKCIVNELKEVNQIPSFTQKYEGISSITYNNSFDFDVVYNPATGYRIDSNPITLTDSRKVLENYPELATNRSVAFRGNNNELRYLNIKSSINGNKLTLTPASVTTSIPTGYTSNKILKADEKGLPVGKEHSLIAYGESGSNSQNVITGCKVDPVSAYLTVGVNYDYEKSNRNFRIVKSTRGSDGTELEDDNGGWYFYVRVPVATGDNTSYKYYNTNTSAVETATCKSTNFANTFGTSKVWKNPANNEYYMIFGPTQKGDGQTATILTYIRRYIDATCGTSGGKEVPYGNYYIYELGRKCKGWTATSSIDGNNSFVDKDPTHYEIPEGYEPYYFTYEEHLNGNKRDGITVGSDEYYKRLKRILCSYTSTTITTATYVNYTKLKLRINKTSEDGKVSDVYFKVTKLDSNGNKVANSEIILGPTDSEGNTKYIWLNFGKYELEELGYADIASASMGRYYFYDYNDKPENQIISVDTESYYEYLDIGYYGVDFLNTAQAKIRILKKTQDGEALDGAVYGIYSSAGKLLETLPATSTVTISNTTYYGFAESENLFKFGDYYIQEISAPDGYYLDENKYPLTISSSTLDRYYGTITKHITKEVTDKITETYLSKTDITGKKELAGAKMRLTEYDASVTNEKVVEEWTTTTEPHLIKGLTAGKKYRLREITPPNGYVTSESNVIFTVKADGTPTYATMKDKETHISFAKTDKNGNYLAGAKMELYDTEQDTSPLFEWTSDTTPYEIIGQLIVGHQYRLHEAEAPSELYKLAEDITFTVEDTAEIQTITMVDELFRGSISITKTDENSKPLAGAEFQLYKSDGTLCKVRTDKKVILNITIPNGIYFGPLSQKIPPLYLNGVLCQYSSISKSSVVTLYYELPTSSIGKNISFGTASISNWNGGYSYHYDGSTLTEKSSDIRYTNDYTISDTGTATITTNSEGVFKVTGLFIGNYYLIETKAPAGKLPYGDEIRFNIDGSSEQTLYQKIIISDESIIMPNTGGNIYVYYTVGIILILLLTTLLYFKKRKERQNEN